MNPLTAPTARDSETSAPVRPLFDQLKDACASDLAAVEREIADILTSDQTELLNEVGQYVQNSAGKQLRPILVLLTGQAFGASGKNLHKVAASMKLVHTATLLHDDVIDKSDMRRGKPTINARFGNNIAILMADYLYSNAFEISLEALKPEILQTICKVTSHMCEGEIFQIEKADTLLTTDDYYKIIRAKTAYLFGACCGLGALLGGAKRRDIEAMSEFGQEFGLAFQITDDILDYTADEDVFGKSVGTDIKGGKQTLPLIYTLNKLDDEKRQTLLQKMAAGDVLYVIDTVEQTGGIEYARTQAAQHIASARKHLASTPRASRLTLLSNLADHILRRAY
jgi:octaprenyl-diphosphate synthase